MGNRVSHVGDTRLVIIGADQDPKAKKKTKENKIVSSKYTVLTFLPKNLFEQFRRIANFYFFVMSVISLLIDSPVSPLTSIFPLVFVVAVTCAKQGYEDWLRHNADNVVNKAEVSVLRDSTLQEILCQEIRLGEVVRVPRDCDVPCDLVLLGTSDLHGKCYVTTANLDGETNLKTLTVPKALQNMDTGQLIGAAVIECQQPIPDLYTFYGRVEMKNDPEFLVPLNEDNLLLRGSMIKNTEWVFGCAIYTGQDTKLALNSRLTTYKFSSSESYINRFLFFFLMLIVFTVTVCFFLKKYFDAFHDVHNIYLGLPAPRSAVMNHLQDIFSFLLLFNYLIPISLYVTIEMHKFICSLFMEWDLELYCPETDQRTIVNTSDLNEELGQIEILFSDKTGTLTKNEMHFQKCSINGIPYREQDGKLYQLDDSCQHVADSPPIALDEFTPEMKEFFKTLALCHTVQVEKVIEMKEPVTGKRSRYKTSLDSTKSNLTRDTIDHPPPKETILYQASSPDEKALLEGCFRVGVEFHGDDGEVLQLKMHSKYIPDTSDGSMLDVADQQDAKRDDHRNNNSITSEDFTRLDVLEFTSERKRMSVIVRSRSGQLWLISKGAESSILPLCTADVNSQKMVVTENHINEFAKQGLRTLVIAAKVISEDDYTKIQEILQKTRSEITDKRVTQIMSAYRDIEGGLTLMGATAVEDALQDDIHDTIESIREAGIKVWVLTGDKVETALNIAHSCGHIKPGSHIFYIVEMATIEGCSVLLAQFKKEINKNHNLEYSLVVDGRSLTILMKNDPSGFREVAISCHAVLCCRLSPLQKCEIVRLIKRSESKPITCAIGDGANDVSMIQEAHIGLGIVGKEGRQAARCADVAFAKFCMIKRIILMHGHWYYNRLAVLVQYFFYKNLLFMSIQFFFQSASMFSSQAIYDSYFLTLYNVVFTSVPILFLSWTEQIYPPHVLLNNPELYKKNTKNRLLSWNHFMGWCTLAIYHAIVIYTPLYYLFQTNSGFLAGGKSADLWCFGTALFHCVIFVANFKLWLHSRYQNLLLISSIILSNLAFVISTIVYSLLHIETSSDMMGVYIQLLAAPYFWYTTIFIFVACLTPDFFLRSYYSMIAERRSKTNHSYGEDGQPVVTSNGVAEGNGSAPECVRLRTTFLQVEDQQTRL